ncbi:MAG: glycine cleavage T C-terminal barrel domain-containing protein, partial [Pseudomonadota bacterium]
NSDIWFWARCVAGERKLDVHVSEPDVSPLAVQGPKAEDSVANLLGDWVRDLKFFWFRDAEIEGIPLKVVRAGWSKQGGYELFLLDGSKGDRLWRLVKEAGQPHGIGPGYPNPSERTESGLLNWGIDTDLATNPFEVRLNRFVDLDVPDDVIGVTALRRIKSEGIRRHQLGIKMGAAEEPEDQSISLRVEKDGRLVGRVTHKAWSYRLQRMIGYALVEIDAQAGDHVQVVSENATMDAELCSLPFLL